MGRHSHRFQYTWSLLEWYSPAAWSARPGSGVGLESMVTSWRCPQGLGRPGRAAVLWGGGGGVGCSVHIVYLSSLVTSHQKYTHPSLLPTGMHCASGQPSIELRTCLQLGQGNAKHNDKRKGRPPLMPWEEERVILLLPNVLFHFY